MKQQTWELKKFEEATESSLDDLDVSDFPIPGIRREDIDNILDHLSKRALRILTDPAPNGVVAADADLPAETKIRKLITQYGNDWQNIEMALIDQYNKMYESIEDDLGMGDFDSPPQHPREFLYPHIQLHYVGYLMGGKSEAEAIVLTCKVMRCTPEDVKMAMSEPEDNPWGPARRQESIEDDLGNVSDEYEEPLNFALMKVRVPDGATSNRDVWKFDGKVVKIHRGIRMEKYYKTVTDDYDYYDSDTFIPVEWCTPVDNFEESVDSLSFGDLGDVGDYLAPERGPRDICHEFTLYMKDHPWWEYEESIRHFIFDEKRASKFEFARAEKYFVLNFIMKNPDDDWEAALASLKWVVEGCLGLRFEDVMNGTLQESTN